MLRLASAYMAVFIAVMLLIVAIGCQYVLRTSRSIAQLNQSELTERALEQVETFLNELEDVSYRTMTNSRLLNQFNRLEDKTGDGNYFDQDILANIDVGSLLGTNNGPNATAWRIVVYNTRGDFISTGALVDKVKRDEVLAQRDVAALQRQLRDTPGRLQLLGAAPDGWSDYYTTHFITLRRPLMNIYSQVVYGVVEVQQDVARLRELLPAETYADMAICVTDQDGVPVLQPAQGIEEMKNPYTVTKTSTAYGWSVSLTQSGRAMIAPYQPLFIGIAVGCTVLVLLVAAVIWLVARRLTAPLVSLRQAVGDISYADVGGLAQPLVGNESMDEVRELNIAFDAMLSRIGESVELEKKAMLLALQSQMNPHFFHNIMTVISGAAMEGKDEQVVRMCTQVCDMSRYIASFEEGDVTVQQELQHLQNYLELMKARYEDLFSYDKNKIRFSIYPYLFIAPTVILIGIFSYYAMFNGIYTSLTDYRISYSEISFIGLENYKTLFSPDGALF